MTCAMHGMWFRSVGPSILEAWRVDSNLRVIESFGKALSVVIPNKQPLVSSTWSRTFFICMASRALVYWPLTYYPWLAFEAWEEQAIDLIECNLYFSQCPISIQIVCKDRQYGQFVLQSPHMQSWTNFIPWQRLLFKCFHCQCIFPQPNHAPHTGKR